MGDNEIKYIEQNEAVDAIAIDYEKIKTDIKPKIVESEIFRPSFPEKIDKPPKSHFVKRKPIQKLNKPIEELVFATLQDYMDYKQLYHQ